MNEPQIVPPMPGVIPEPEPGDADDVPGYTCWRAWLAATSATARGRAEALTMCNYGTWRSSVPTVERNRWVRFAAELHATGALPYLTHEE